MTANGFSPQAWDSHMETYPKCFIHPRDDSIQFYLQKLGPQFIENLLKDAKNNPIGDADTFTECSRFEEYTCFSDIPTNENSAEPNDARPAPIADEVDIDLTAVPSEKTNCYSEISDALQSLEPLSCQSTPSLMDQVSLKRTELITLNQKAVSNEDTSTPVQPDAQALKKTVGPAEKPRSAQKLLSSTRSGMNRSSIPYAYDSPLTRGRAHSLSILTPETLKMKKKNRSGRVVVPALDPGNERIVYNTTVGPAEKPRSAQKLLSSTRSGMNRRPSPYAYNSPLTRGRAHSLSISTPESLKMKKTNSGRVVVPALDTGNERIVYNTDGMISGVSPVFQSTLRGGPAKKRK